jgi:hypothetical protein
MKNLHLRQWIGMKAMMVYVTIAEEIFEGFLIGWYYDGTNNTMVREHINHCHASMHDLDRHDDINC